MSCVFHRLRHRWFPWLTRKAFLGWPRPPRPPQKVGRCRGLRKPGGPHGHRFGPPLSRPPKAKVWYHVQDQPRSTCLVGMIWVKDQHAQHWPWTLSKWRQGGASPPCFFFSKSMVISCVFVSILRYYTLYWSLTKIILTRHVDLG